MLKIFITSLICTLMLFCTNVSAADFQAGDTAYVKAGIESMSVYQNPSYGRSVAVVIQYNKVTILEPNVVGDGGTFHKIQLQDGTIGYVPALAGRKDTLETAEVAEKEIEKSTASSDPDKYQHTINMYFLSDYIYGGSKQPRAMKEIFMQKSRLNG